jgi:hypothetical protein
MVQINTKENYITTLIKKVKDTEPPLDLMNIWRSKLI